MENKGSAVVRKEAVRKVICHIVYQGQIGMCHVCRYICMCVGGKGGVCVFVYVCVCYQRYDVRRAVKGLYDYHYLSLDISPTLFFSSLISSLFLN